MYDSASCTTYQSLLIIGRSLCDLAALICAYGLNKTNCQSITLEQCSFSMCSLKVDLQQRIEVLWTSKHIPRLLHKQTYSHVDNSQNVIQKWAFFKRNFLTSKCNSKNNIDKLCII